jgi:hypothetical protein
MGAPKGNTYWKNVINKTGRPRIFESPEILWKRCCEYFEWVDENPIIKTDFKGKDAQSVKYELQRPYTWSGLYVFLGVCNLEYYKEKNEFSEILTHITNVIYTQKLEGAAAGIFNAQIIAKEIGLTDKIDHGIVDKEAWKTAFNPQVTVVIEGQPK